ncbi:MAG TPA: DUF4350 domain-containing protein [Candidatus Cybelea sp.]|jgi:hypothetical protein|nr:DUF4350 domain-containing protein [Candidatus Cybelea sp.]
MKQRRVELAILAFCAVAIVVLAYERGAIQRREPASVFSTYDTGPNGYRALYEVLASAGVPVHRFEESIGEIDPSVKTLVITGYENDPNAQGLDWRESALLRDFVLGGGRLVVIDEQFAGSQDITPGVGTSLPAMPGRDAIPLARNAWTQGVSHAIGPIYALFPFKDTHGIPLLASARGLVAVWYRLGRGRVIAITAPALFSNAQLRNADNLRFAYNVLTGHGPVAFDEYVHGYKEDPTMWGVLPAPVRAAVWIVGALALIALIGANVPFAPPYLAEPLDERDSSHYITAVAELMRRSRRRPSDYQVVAQAIDDYWLRKEHV